MAFEKINPISEHRKKHRAEFKIRNADRGERRAEGSESAPEENKFEVFNLESDIDKELKQWRDSISLPESE